MRHYTCCDKTTQHRKIVIERSPEEMKERTMSEEELEIERVFDDDCEVVSHYYRQNDYIQPFHSIFRMKMETPRVWVVSNLSIY